MIWGVIWVCCILESSRVNNFKNIISNSLKSWIILVSKQSMVKYNFRILHHSHRQVWRIIHNKKHFLFAPKKLFSLLIATMQRDTRNAQKLIDDKISKINRQSNALLRCRSAFVSLEQNEIHSHNDEQFIVAIRCSFFVLRMQISREAPFRILCLSTTLLVSPSQCSQKRECQCLFAKIHSRIH